MSLTLSRQKSLQTLQGGPTMGMGCMSKSPGRKSRRDYAYQEAPTLPVICKAQLQRMFRASRETVQTLKNRWWLHSSPHTSDGLI